MSDTAAPLPASPQTSGTAARRLVETLVMNGIDRVFCVPGESYLAVLDALGDHRDAIKVITCRHEAGAANMAEAYGKLTGKPGVCMVTRGPGATQAAIGVHTAHQDSTPMILFVGQIALTDRGRGAFQEVDYRQVFGGLAKWATEIESPERTTEIVERAFSTALQGRMGPVVVALPEDILHCDGGPAPQAPVVAAASALSDTFLAELASLLSGAERPLLVLGGSGWTQAASDAIGQWSERHRIPLTLSFRRKDILSNDHPCYGGDLGLGCNPELMQRARDSDLIIAIGARLGENPTQGYSLFERAQTGTALVHIHPGPEELGRVWPTRLSACADVSLAAMAISRIDPGRRWDEEASAARATYDAFSEPVGVGGQVNMSELVKALGETLPADAIVTNGAGNFAAWLHRFYRHRACRTQLAPTSGAMGYGLPAALAAKSLHPDKVVVAVTGDGDFMMSVSEMATAAQHGLNIITLVVDNGAYGTIRMHQESHYPGRVVATDLRNPDFVALAESFGGKGYRVETTEAFAPALKAAMDAGAPALIHILTDAEDIAPGRTLSGLREAARSKG